MPLDRAQCKFHIKLDLKDYQNLQYETFDIIWFEDMTL